MGKGEKGLDRGALIIGGTTMIGLGVGFIFFHRSIFWFLASLMIGIGFGLLVAALFGMSQSREDT